MAQAIQFRRRLAMAAVLLCTAVVPRVRAVDEPEPPPMALSDEGRAEIQKWIDLGVAETRRREAAEVVISMQHFDAWPQVQKMLEAAKAKADLDGQLWLDAIIGRQGTYAAARLRAQERGVKDWQWNLRTALEGYDKVGHKDPKWDDAARRGIRGFVANSGADRELIKGLDEAVEAGCDDPLVLYFYARAKERAGMAQEQLEPIFHNAADVMEASNYPADRKAFAALRYFQYRFAIETRNAINEKRNYDHEAWKLLMQKANSVWDTHWGGMCAQPDVTPRFRLEVAEMLFDAYEKVPKDRIEIFNRLFPDLQRLVPDGPEPLLFKGHFYVKYAWDARGSGWANTVTPDGWKKMAERLAIAREALTKAYEMDPTRDEAAVEMLTVELGEGNGRGSMDEWFARAMKANPDSKQACSSKMYYLQPKWHGSPQEIVDFGRECFETRNWLGDIPFQLITAHDEVSKMTTDPDAYLRDPSVWRDIARVYEPFLEGQPKNTWARSRYAYYAARTEHWEIAAREFRKLGDGAVRRQFGDAATMEEMRRNAYEHVPETPK